MFNKMIFYVNTRNVIQCRLSMRNTNFKDNNTSFIFALLNHLSFNRDSRWTPYERKELNCVYWEFSLTLLDYFIEYFNDFFPKNCSISKLIEYKELKKVYEDSDVTVDF